MQGLRFMGFAIIPVALAFIAFTCAPKEGGGGAEGPRRFPTPLQSLQPQQPQHPQPTQTPAVPNPISIENALPGDPSWEITAHAGASLEAYASKTSVARGESVDVHVRANAANTITWKAYRMGHYGGAGARLVAESAASIAVGPQPVPIAAPGTGLVECTWPVTFSITPSAEWVTGVYLVKLRNANSKNTYVSFVVRDDERVGAAVLQVPVTTYQAYNTWGGESLYKTSIGLSAGKAKEVSFDRPHEQGDGTGQLFRFDRYFIQWAESRGYDLVYVTNLDFERDPDLLTGQRLFLSIGHDEYWSRPQREAVEQALANGTSLGFFSSNDAYWQVRVEPSRTDGRPSRTVVCWKDRAPIEDPRRGTNVVTNKWRDPEVDEPENELLGVMYSDYQYVDAGWVVANADAWPYLDTGLANGDTIPLIVGYEVDRFFDNGRSPAGLTLLSQSPIVTYRNTPEWHNAATYDTDAGAFVFAAGTIQWSWGLSLRGVADARVQKITDNVFHRSGLLPLLEGDPFGADEAPGTVFTAGERIVERMTGSEFAEGLLDGPNALARFRRPLGAAVDAQGALYVTDTGNHVVRRILGGHVTTIAGVGAPGLGLGTGPNAALSAPSGIAVAADGSLLVSDTGNSRIVRIIPASGGWTVSHFAGSLNGASGLASGAPTDARFQQPGGIVTVGPSIYLADANNSRVCLLGTDGTVTTVVGAAGRGLVDGPGATARLRFPTGLAYANEALWVVDSGNRRVRRIALDGLYTTTTIAGAAEGGFREGTAAQARFMPQLGIAVMNGQLLLADTGNNRVRRIAGGAVTTFAGTGAAKGGGTTAALATIPLPSALVPLPTGELVVVSHGDSTIRLIRPPE